MLLDLVVVFLQVIERCIIISIVAGALAEIKLAEVDALVAIIIEPGEIVFRPVAYLMCKIYGCVVCHTSCSIIFGGKPRSFVIARWDVVVVHVRFSPAQKRASFHLLADRCGTGCMSLISLKF